MTDRRFQGIMSRDYLLVRQAIPDFHEVQALVAEAVAGYRPPVPSGPIRVLDLGCGDGVTSRTLLGRRPDMLLTSLDSEEGMLGQAAVNLASEIRAGRCRQVLQDALAYLRGSPDSAFDAVASALVLHNMDRDYRCLLHREVFRVLNPGGLFVNADKYAEDDVHRFKALQTILGRFFDTFVPAGKLDLLRAAVLHEVGDAAPDRVMPEAEAVRELAALGFRGVEVRRRLGSAALLVASKPG